MPRKPRVFDAETKVWIVKRMLSGEPVQALALELKVSRTFLYRWKERYRESGAAGFQVRRGRPKAEASTGDLRSRPVGDLDTAKRRISELERKIGQQELELDFFRRALRQVGTKRQPTGGSGAKSSTPSSRR